jgi:hypothetical protein
VDIDVSPRELADIARDWGTAIDVLVPGLEALRSGKQLVIRDRSIEQGVVTAGALCAIGRQAGACVGVLTIDVAAFEDSPEIVERSWRGQVWTAVIDATPDTILHMSRAGSTQLPRTTTILVSRASPTALVADLAPSFRERLAFLTVR